MPLSVRRFLAFVPYIGVTVWHLVALLLGNEEIPRVTKGWLMVTLLIAFLVALDWRRAGGSRGHQTPAVIAVVVGLFFSWVGDTSLLYASTTAFLTGLGAFLVAHLLYLLAFFQVAGSRIPKKRFALAYLLWFVVLLILLGPHTGMLLAPVALYGAALAATGIIASTVNLSAAIGGLLFVLSDSLLGVNKFVTDASIWEVDFLIMVTYTGAQLGIVWGMVRALDRGPRRRPEPLEVSVPALPRG